MRRAIIYGAPVALWLAVFVSAQQQPQPSEWLTWGYDQQRTGWNRGDGADKAFIELLGSEKVLDEKRQKRAEIRAKKVAEAKKAMENAEAQAQAEGGAEAPAEGGEKKEKE